jgi:uncharacterized membrane protein
MLNNIVHSGIGLFHTITAIMAMVLGLVVVFRKKGTLSHKRLGYAYVIAMILLNGTAFFIVNFGGFSIFHAFAIISLLTVLAGVIPAIRKSKNWYVKHYYFMSWSVVGLYCAFWSEVGTRFVGNMKQFWWMVALATLLTVFIGSRIINKEAKKLKLKE